MAGAMWQLASGLSAEIQFVPGYSFNSVASSKKNVVRAQVAVPQAVTDIGNIFAWETRLALCREVGPRLGRPDGRRTVYAHAALVHTFADGTHRVWKADRCDARGETRPHGHQGSVGALGVDENERIIPCSASRHRNDWLFDCWLKVDPTARWRARSL
jgi:hypothetical protein